MRWLALFIVFVCNFSFSQESKLFQFNINFPITSEVFEEAEEKNIKRDRVFITIYMDNDCKVTKVEVYKKGEFDSLNDLIIKNNDKIAKEFENKIDCNLIKKNENILKITIPLTFRLIE